MSRQIRSRTIQYDLSWACCCGWLLIWSLAGNCCRADEIHFNRDIRPILSDHCFQCHGPDEKQRQAKLRLDLEEGALLDLGGRAAVVPGKPDDSELIARVFSTDHAERMPPPDSGHPLTAQQKELLKKWVAQGAVWQKHWSLLPPSRPALPKVSNPAWCRNPIDHFILAKLDSQKLQPSSEAERTTLLRRVTFDLTGLPPSSEEIRNFLSDAAPDAYERVVDRLLKSPRYGERMASRWLDGARYADTSGYQSDGERSMWRWRDWVIDAYNRNMPFDQFTLEQMAGDMLPQATRDQIIATGFHRNHRGNAEGGIVPEEFAVEYVVDRVDTTFTVWLGLSMGCARCHDHKFDPISQREYYRVFSLFNNIPEKGRAIKYGNSPPYIPAPTAEQEAELADLDARIHSWEQKLSAAEPAIAAAQRDWETKLKSSTARDPELPFPLIACFPFEGNTDANPPLPVPKPTGKEPAKPDIEPAPPALTYIPGPVGQAANFTGQEVLSLGSLVDFGFYDPFTITAWVKPVAGKGGTIIGKMTDVPQGDGWSVDLVDGRIRLHLTKRWLDDALRVDTEAQLTPDTWQHISVSYDGSRVASGVKIHLNGKPVPTRVLLDELNQTFTTKEPLRIGGGHGPEGRFHGGLDEIRIYSRDLTDVEVETVATPRTLAEIVAIAPAQRSPGEAHKLRQIFLKDAAAETLKEPWRQMKELHADRRMLVSNFPTVMIMKELPQPRPAYVLLRGEYDKRGEQVSPGVPESLSVNPNAVKNRLDFARWLLSPQHPLTARVAVNRFWQMYFGTGLVKTGEDFGSQGEWPSHPELLDWLATEFIANGWDVKAMQRLIVTSAVYRQSARVAGESARRDPENRWLSRGPRQRLSAEMVRDQALFASGLLNGDIGGPSVKPYQPAGLWNDLADAEYVQDHGDKLYRRSLYTYWKRTIAPPAMLLFDAAGRETCLVRETRTNTPLQALNLMNDVTYLEAARELAARVMNNSQDQTAILSDLYLRVLSREPSPRELELLKTSWGYHEQRFAKAPDTAQTYLRQGERPVPEDLPPVDLAAYATIAQMLFNLDEAVMK